MKQCISRRRKGSAEALRIGSTRSAVKAAASARARTPDQPTSDLVASTQRDALSAWEDEGGTTKLVAPRRV